MTRHTLERNYRRPRYVSSAWNNYNKSSLKHIIDDVNACLSSGDEDCRLDKQVYLDYCDSVLGESCCDLVIRHIIF